MRWFRRARRARTEESGADPLGGYTPGSWAQVGDPGPISMEMPPPESMVTVVPPPAPAEVAGSTFQPPLVGPPTVPVEHAPAPPPFSHEPSAATYATPDASPSIPLSMPVPEAPAAAPAASPFPAVPMAASQAPVSPEPVAPPPAVRLGFEDGSDLGLDPADPHAVALKAVAEVLVHKDPRP